MAAAKKQSKKKAAKRRGVTAPKVRRVTSKRGRPPVGKGNGKPRLTAKKRAEQEKADALKLAAAQASASSPSNAEFAEPNGYFGDAGDEFDEFDDDGSLG